jgi:hypothetical protein
LSWHEGGISKVTTLCRSFWIDFRKIHNHIADYPKNQQYGCDMEIARIIDLKNLLEKKSFFLFGPRATGKSTLVARQLSDSATIIDLLNSRLFLRQEL